MLSSVVCTQELSKPESHICGCLQYSLWLDQHSMNEVLKFIKGALNAAAVKVEQDEDCKELVSIMTQICSRS